MHQKLKSLALKSFILLANILQGLTFLYSCGQKVFNVFVCSGYEVLFKKLSLQDIKDEDVFVEMIRTIYPNLIKSFRASEVLPILYSLGTIRSAF